MRVEAWETLKTARRSAVAAAGAAVLSACLLLAGGPVAGWAAEPAGEGVRSLPVQGGEVGRAGEPGKAVRSVTLITGDRVLVSGTSVRVVPGPGRGRIPFRTYRVDDHLHVIPSDASRLVSAGRLDGRLFDVTELVRSGYDDAHRETVPLIMSGRSVLSTTIATAGILVNRTLGAVDGAAVALPKRLAGTYWQRLAGNGSVVQSLAGGKIWLDGRRRALLDKSVPQINAPSAWRSGLTGKGVTVAVVDTGIDRTHPDLAGQVVRRRNFTKGPAVDGIGHGTHVASTIVGTGKASDGKYKGVAPGAKVLDAQVCDADGWCDESAMIAGIQWAVAQHAPVVNLSLGGPNTPDIDPVEKAINTLTAKHGTLFVVAAGNEGPDPGTVASPATASAALAVGAVDGKGRIADFSSRGPATGQGSLKPEITAPGVGIVAARAKGTELGPLVGDKYVSSDGTSMAAPHVSGAAAILLQRHPKWKSPALKAALVSSARPQASGTVYDQGAGLVDVGRAVRTPVLSMPVSLSFGRALWPHSDDAAVRKTLTYRNAGSKPLSLRLSTVFRGPGGKAAPASALRLSARRVVVPAGGRAEVTVSATGNHKGKDGLYGGRIQAKGPDGLSIVTPLGLDKEPESYDLKIKHLDRSGRQTTDFHDVVFGVDNKTMQEFSGSAETGSVTSVRLRKGVYSLESGFESGPESDPDSDLLVRPLVKLDRDRSYTMDARQAKPISIRVPEKSARPAILDVGYVREGPAGRSLDSSLTAGDFGGIRLAQLGPEVAKDKLRSRIGTQLGDPGPKGDFAGTPYIYALLWRQDGSFFNGFRRTLKDSQLASVTRRFGAQRSDRAGTILLSAAIDGVPGGWAYGFPVRLPSTVRTYHTTAGHSWDISLAQEVKRGDLPVEESSLTVVDRQYDSGREYQENWNSPVFGPAFPKHYLPWVVRNGNELTGEIPLFSDSAGHMGSSETDSARTELYRGGKRIAKSDMPGFVSATLPAGPADYRLETTAKRSGVSDYSTEIRAKWLFRSEKAPKPGVELPLWVVRFEPAVDETGRLPWSPRTRMNVRAETQPAANAGLLRAISVEVSLDDGKTWTPTRLESPPVDCGCTTSVVSLPKSGGYVSLRAKAVDSRGNAVDQTIIRAYKVD